MKISNTSKKWSSCCPVRLDHWRGGVFGALGANWGSGNPPAVGIVSLCAMQCNGGVFSGGGVVKEGSLCGGRFLSLSRQSANLFFTSAPLRDARDPDSESGQEEGSI